MLNNKQKNFVDTALKMFNKEVLTIDEVKQVNQKFGCKHPPQWLCKNKDYKVGKQTFKLPIESDIKVSAEKIETKSANNSTPVTTNKEAAYIVSSLTGDIVPTKDKNFVSFGNYPDVKNIIKSNRFYPVFVTGLSGNGKTLAITQACAELKKELIRVNVTIETDEDALLGGYRLKDGQSAEEHTSVLQSHSGISFAFFCL